MRKFDLYIFLWFIVVCCLVGLACLPKAKKEEPQKNHRTFQDADSLMKADTITIEDLTVHH